MYDRTFMTRLIILPIIIFLLLSCTTGSPMTTPNRSALARWDASENFEPRKAQLIIIHHTNMNSFAEALQTLKTRNPDGRVSAHYLIGRDGELVQLVADDQRAWHAGVSRWQGRGDLNSASIGIELDNDGYTPFPKAQIDVLLSLLRDLTTRLGIEPQQVWAHADIAPARKDDPNKFFPWQSLAEQGFGLWPRTPLPVVPEHFDAWTALALIGYDMNDKSAALVAFHRHYFGLETAELRPEDLPVLVDLQQQILMRR
jgi:N-acetylmuramoyl-L-alanine amidase